MKFSVQEIYELKDEINESLTLNGISKRIEIDFNYGVMTINEIPAKGLKCVLLQYAKGDNACRFLMGYRYAMQLRYNQSIQFTKESWLIRVLKNRPVY